MRLGASSFKKRSRAWRQRPQHFVNTLECTHRPTSTHLKDFFRRPRRTVCTTPTSANTLATIQRETQRLSMSTSGAYTQAASALTRAYETMLNFNATRRVLTERQDMDVSGLYIDMTLAMILCLITTLGVVKVVPYMTSAISFFIKFCICTALLSLVTQLLQNSELYKAVADLF